MRVTRVTRASRLMRVTRVTRVTRVPRVTRVTRVTRLTSVTRVTRAAKVIRATRLMRVTRATRVIWVTTSAGTCQYLKQATRSARLGTRCWESPNLNNFDIKHIASLKETILEDFVERANNNVDGDFLHLATALDPRWKDLKVNNKSGREGC